MKRKMFFQGKSGNIVIKDEETGFLEEPHENVSDIPIHVSTRRHLHEFYYSGWQDDWQGDLKNKTKQKICNETVQTACLLNRKRPVKKPRISIGWTSDVGIASIIE